MRGQVAGWAESCVARATEDPGMKASSAQPAFSEIHALYRLVG